MTFSDYAIDILLIGLVLLQVRGRRLTLHSMLLPIVLVAYVADSYLKAVPTGGNDLLLIVGCSLLGALIGGLCALFTGISRGSDGVPIAKAGLVAAALWVLGVGTRFAFQLYANYGGGPAIQRFSVAHHITTIEAWTAALILWHRRSRGTHWRDSPAGAPGQQVGPLPPFPSKSRGRQRPSHDGCR